MFCFRDATAVNPTLQDRSSPIHPNFELTKYDFIMLDVDDILFSPSASLVLRPPALKAVCEMLRDDSGLFLATVCESGKIFSGQFCAFTRNFLLIIRRIATVHWKQHKLSNCYSCANQFVAGTSPARNTTVVTATTHTRQLGATATTSTFA